MANKVCKKCGQRKIVGDFTDLSDNCKTCTPEVKKVEPPKPIKLEVEVPSYTKPKFNDKWKKKDKDN